VQSIYGIRDHGSAVSGRSNLVQQNVLDVATVSGETYRAVSANVVNWTSKSGWYLDLPVSGERVAVDPILRNGRLIVPTMVPSADPCAVGGYSWMMAIDYLTGGRQAHGVFDVNKDGKITDVQDAVEFSNLAVGTQQASGLLMDAIASSPAVVRGFGDDGTVEMFYSNTGDGDVGSGALAGDPLSNRRMSWRQIQ
jgi:type IV pilus assembly protein PilY1